MKAIAIVPGTTTLRLVDRPVPSITARDEVKVQVLSVGICGTDREEVAGGAPVAPLPVQRVVAAAPLGQPDLVIGHEMFGRVVEVGRSVTRVRPGDHAVFTVRRGCGKCLSCAMNRPDMCRTGEYRERGIWGLDGYQAEFVVDREQYVVRVPPELKSLGVLSEPLSVAEKAIDEAVRLQTARLPDAPSTPDWLHGRRCLVAGLGPIGLLAAMALRIRGGEVYGLDVVGAGTARPAWLEGIGGRYVDGRKVPVDRMDEILGPMEMILEATGVAALEFNLLDALAPNGICVLTGIPGGNRRLEVQGAELIRRLVLGNQAMVGSVNAARDHFQMAVNDLGHAHLLWGDHVEQLITRSHPFTDYEAALRQHPPDEIKSVIEWAADPNPKFSTAKAP